MGTPSTRTLILMTDLIDARVPDIIFRNASNFGRPTEINIRIQSDLRRTVFGLVGYGKPLGEH